MEAHDIARELIAQAGKGGALLDLGEALIGARGWREAWALVRLIWAVVVV